MSLEPGKSGEADTCYLVVGEGDFSYFFPSSPHSSFPNPKL